MAARVESMEPQPWDTGKVAEAFADAREIVEALGADFTGDRYREALGRLMELRLDSESDEDVVNRLAYVLYGFTLFGLGALTVAEIHSRQSREKVIAEIGKALDRWLG